MLPRPHPASGLPLAACAQLPRGHLAVRVSVATSSRAGPSLPSAAYWARTWSGRGARQTPTWDREGVPGSLSTQSCLPGRHFPWPASSARTPEDEGHPGPRPCQRQDVLLRGESHSEGQGTALRSCRPRQRARTCRGAADWVRVGGPCPGVNRVPQIHVYPECHNKT